MSLIKTGLHASKGKKNTLVYLFSKWSLNDSCEAVSLNPAFPWALAAVIGQYVNELLRDVQP